MIANNRTNDDIYNGATSEGIEAIASALKLSSYEHQALERHKKLSELADGDLAYTIRHSVHYLWADYWFDDAVEWLSIKSEKYDKRRNYPEKESYDRLVAALKESLQVDTLEIVNLCYEGYQAYTRWIDFITDSDYVFHMTVPVIERITAKLLPYVDYGKLYLGYYSSQDTMRMCGSSYNAKDLKPIMNEILTSEEHEKHLSKFDRRSI